MSEKQMLTAQEAMDYLGIGRTKLYQHVKDGSLKIYKSKSNAKVSYFSKTELDELRGFEEVSISPKTKPATAL